MKNRKLAVFIRILVLVLVLLLVFLSVYLIILNKEEVVYNAPRTAVAVIKPERRTIEESVTLSGYTESTKISPVIPFVSGTVESFDLTVGDEVKKGDVIAVIDDEPYVLQLNMAKVQVDVLSSSYERMEKLYQTGAVTKQDLESIKAQLDAAEEQMKLASLQVDYATVRAEMDGTVILTNTNEANIASSSDYIAVLADMSSIKVTLDMNESYYSRIRENMSDVSVYVYSPATGESSTARIESVSPVIDPLSKTFEVTVILDNPSGFAIGGYVKADFIFSRNENVLSLPSSVRKADGGMYVYDEDEEKALYVTFTSEYSDDEYFSVPESYEDTYFISSGQDLVLDGSPVNAIVEE